MCNSVGELCVTGTHACINRKARMEFDSQYVHACVSVGRPQCTFSMSRHVSVSESELKMSSSRSNERERNLFCFIEKGGICHVWWSQQRSQPTKSLLVSS